MLVKEGEGGRGLVDPDELLGALEDVLRLLMRRRRLSTDVSGGPEGQRGSWAVVTARGGVVVVQRVGQGGAMRARPREISSISGLDLP